jgi:meso-butanediol dehydrogenase/(S,S)-butanediol dehydrogenase/diacetyl reductase
MGRMTGKVAIITGAGSGMGRATAIALAAEGASVVAADIDEAGLAAMSAEATGQLETQICDVRSSEQVQGLVALAEERFGALNAMLNCAGVLRSALFEDTSDADWEFQIAVNLMGVFYGCKHAIPALKRAGGGAVVNWGSINSMVAEPELAAYSATKGGVLMLTKTLAIEYAKDGIRANCICPGAVRTPLNAQYFDSMAPEQFEALNQYQPLGMGSPEQIASIAVFLASDDSSLMTGSAVMADGGCTAQ